MPPRSLRAIVAHMPQSVASLNNAWELHDRAARACRGEAGCVYTPRAVALQLAEAVLSPLVHAPTLLDPASGGGALLLGAIEWASRERPGWLAHWFGGGMSGWDVSPTAVAACNAVLGLAARELGFAARDVAVVRDALEEEPEGAFEVVVANPPWVSYSGRQSDTLERARRIDLQARFSAFRGWPSLHAAFAQRCAALTRMDGRCGLLLPMQVADLAGYKAARDAMTARHGLVALENLGESAFDGVIEPVGMFVLGPGASDATDWQPSSAPAALGRFKQLPTECFGDIGVHTGNAGELLIARSIEPGAQPIRIGRDIEPYRLAAPSRWLRDVDLPPGKYARAGDKARFAQALILLRQTASRPIAARHEPAALFRNSVLACFGAPEHDPDFLVGWFNSEVVGQWHFARHRDARQRSFPQVKISHLRALPVPGRDIGPLYEQLANASRAGDAAAVNALATRLIA